MQLIYLDNATLLPPSHEILEAIWPFYESHWANPASPHDLGQNLIPILAEAYNEIGRLLSLPNDASIVVTSSGAEATMQGITSIIHHQLYEHGKNHIAIARFHDAAASMSVKSLQEDSTLFSSYIEANKEGFITRETLQSAINPKTACILFPLVHPLLGTIQPIDIIYEEAKKAGISCLIDISNAIGTTMIDLSQFDSCYYTIRGEAIGIPRGVSGLLIQMPNAPSLQLLIHGIESSFSYRGGPLNVAGIIGFKKALQICKEREILYCTEVAHMRRLFEETLYQKIEKGSLSLPFAENEMMAPHISCILFKGVKNEAMLYQLNKKKVYATIGGCGLQNISDVLSGLEGFSKSCDLFSAISFSLSSLTTDEEILEAVDRIIAAYSLVKKVSPYQERGGY